jgi:hypothetical protein
VFVWLFPDELEAQALTDAGAGDVSLVVIDLNVLAACKAERCIGQERRRRGSQSTAQTGRVNPVADLERPGSTAMESTSPGSAFFSKDGERHVASV